LTVKAQPRPRRGGFFLFALFVLAALGILVALGTWQLQRKAWKDELIAQLDAKLAASPTDLPARERWQRLDAGADEFRRVAFPAEFLPAEEALVYSSGSALRPDAVGPGYWVFAPARLTGGSIVVVNRGFLPEGRQDAKTRGQGQTSGVVDIVGVMRWPEARNQFTPPDEPSKNLWFARDPASMAAAKNWGSVAPFYIDQEAPAAPGGLPKVGPLKASLPNNHLQYAVTWYGLAFAILIATIFFWRARRSSSID
jgi:surfeit locus 1 family protein